MSVHTAGRIADPGRRSTAEICPIERAMTVVGTRSAIVLMREASYGTTRFDDFARRGGLTEAVAASRLKELVGAGLLRKEPYREPGQRTRQAYALTEAGRDLLPVLVALGEWGTRHLPRRRTPELTHLDCGERVGTLMACDAGHVVTEDDIVVSA